jgi:5-(carboxyamino)imidazole ribonucleotide mutase
MDLEEHILLWAGSPSDAIVVEEKCANVLDAMGVPYRYTSASAHRDPEATEAEVDYARSNILVIIATAGLGSCALPGQIAALDRQADILAVPLDVEGLESVLGTPPDIPLSVMGYGPNALTKAALKAAIIVGKHDPEVARRHLAYITGLKEKKPPNRGGNIHEVAAEERAKKEKKAA